MWPMLIVIGVVFFLPIVYVVLTYNTLVALRNHIRDAWGNIDTELKRRYDLIPNLVATVKGYAAHEKEIFERVTQLRAQCLASRGAARQQAADETLLVGALQQLLGVVENYPQ
ncbi:MAG: LemA family protein, partial [Sedimentisphaerales bacterium]